MHTSTLMLLGMVIVPDHLYAARENHSKIKNSMPVNPNRSFRRVLVNKEQKEKLMECILLKLGNGVTDHIRMYDEMLKEQAISNVPLLPTNDFGDILSIYSFRDLVLEVKRKFPGAIKDVTNKSAAISQMYIDGFSKKEIAIHYGITSERVHRILVAQGLVTKRKSPIKKTNKDAA